MLGLPQRRGMRCGAACFLSATAPPSSSASAARARSARGARGGRCDGRSARSGRSGRAQRVLRRKGALACLGCRSSAACGAGQPVYLSGHVALQRRHDCVHRHVAAHVAGGVSPQE
jgi:hypothetical protein